MLTSKQRAKLRALANSAEMILQVGKGGISPHLVKQADDALTARELIKEILISQSLNFRNENRHFWRDVQSGPLRPCKAGTPLYGRR